VIRLLQGAPGQGQLAQRIRLRAVEVLGLMPCLEAVQPLLGLFDKKGLFKGRETLGVRLAAARALAACNTRESREALALALEAESQEEVRTVLRHFLARG
jgi:HEAT repeat protein